jgi:hypothetical protein
MSLGRAFHDFQAVVLRLYEGVAQGEAPVIQDLLAPDVDGAGELLE